MTDHKRDIISLLYMRLRLENLKPAHTSPVPAIAGLNGFPAALTAENPRDTQDMMLQKPDNLAEQAADSTI